MSVRPARVLLGDEVGASAGRVWVGFTIRPPPDGEITEANLSDFVLESHAVPALGADPAAAEFAEHVFRLIRGRCGWISEKYRRTFGDSRIEAGVRGFPVRVELV